MKVGCSAVTDLPQQPERARFPASWDKFLALGPGDHFEVYLSPSVPLAGEDPPEQRAGRRGQHVGQVRGVLADQVVVSTPLDPFLPLKALADYSGLSVRTLRDYLADLLHPLPCYRVGGKILVRRSEFDAWIARYRQLGSADVDRIVSEALQGLR